MVPRSLPVGSGVCGANDANNTDRRHGGVCGGVDRQPLAKRANSPVLRKHGGPGGGFDQGKAGLEDGSARYRLLSCLLCYVGPRSAAASSRSPRRGSAPWQGSPVFRCEDLVRKFLECVPRGSMVLLRAQNELERRILVQPGPVLASVVCP